MDKWRPEGWINPYNAYTRNEMKNLMVHPPSETKDKVYEAGANAMLKAITEELKSGYEIGCQSSSFINVFCVPKRFYRALACIEHTPVLPSNDERAKNDYRN